MPMLNVTSVTSVLVLAPLGGVAESRKGVLAPPPGGKPGVLGERHELGLQGTCYGGLDGSWGTESPKAGTINSQGPRGKGEGFSKNSFTQTQQLGPCQSQGSAGISTPMPSVSRILGGGQRSSH